MCWLFVGYVSIDIWLQYGFHGVGHMKEKKMENTGSYIYKTARRWL